MPKWGEVMGGRGGKYDAASQIIGQYGISSITDSKAKIIQFMSKAERERSVRFTDGKLKVKRDTMQEARELAAELSQRIEVRDKDAERDYRDIRSLLSQPHSLSAQDRHDIPDFNAYVRSSENFVRISNNNATQSVDQLYEDLADRYPQYFDRSVTAPSDQLREINYVMSGLKNSSTALPKSEQKYIADELTQDIIRYHAANQYRKERRRQRRRSA